VKKYAIVALLSLLIAGAASLAHGHDDAHGLEIAGASTIQAVAEAVGELYQRRYGVRALIRGGGSRAGIQSVLSGAADIGLVSRALKPAEKARLGSVVIGHDAVVIIVNSGNSLSEIKKDSLVALYSGAVRNWKELGGKDEPVLLVSKRPGRSTLELFEKYTGLAHPSQPDTGPNGSISKNAYEIGSNLESATLVGGLPGAIGYVSMGSARSLIAEGMPIKILEPEGAAGATRGGYPISRELNLVFRKDNRQIKKFVELFLGPDGQRVLRGHGFIPLKGDGRHETVGNE
jgi:phosphate transport system substrate-binding protein